MFLHILVILPIVTAFDICHDPRSRYFNRSCARPSFAVQIPSVHGNPNHALHDTLWAFSHYLRNCAKRPLTVYTETEHELEICEKPDVEPQPDWGVCVAYILTRAAGAKIETDVRGIANAGKGDVCHSRETVLRQKMKGWPETFRGLNWFVDYEDGLGHVKLASNMTAKAFRHIRSTVWRFYGLDNKKAGGGNKINVLIYDRSDARRRKWANAQVVEKTLRKIGDVNMRYTKSIPNGLGKQVKLFGKTDVLIAPHGAAMSNTVFMREGGAVVEIAKECDKKDWVKRQGSQWTGWHAKLVGLKLVYVGCQGGKDSTYSVDAKETEKAAIRLVKEIRERRMRKRPKLKKTLR